MVLSGWLYQTARLTAANFVKGEIRRQQREQEAYMQSTLNEPAGEPAGAWNQIAPLLEEAMGRLAELKGPDQHLGLLPKPFDLEELIEVVGSVTSATLSR